MAYTEFESVLKDAGFEAASLGLLPQPSLPLSTVPNRRDVVSGRRVVGAATIEVQLQEVYSFNGSGYGCLARITAPSVRGEGMFRPRVLWGTFRLLTAGPKIAVVLLAVLMLAGVGVVMLPGVFMVWLARRARLSRMGIASFSDLVIAGAASRYLAWGTDHERAREALPAALQEALVAQSWFGYCEVTNGTVILESPAGFSRVDLFRSIVDAAVRVGELHSGRSS